MSTSPIRQASTQPVPWSKAAIASTTLAIIGFLTLGLIGGLFLAAIAAVLGHVGRHETGNDDLRGRGLATFGLVLSYGTMLLFPVLALIVAVSFPAFFKWQSDQTKNQLATSRENAAILYTAAEAYARENYNRYPTDWDQLSGRFLSVRELKRSLQSPYPDGPEIGFELVPHDRPVIPAISDSVIVIQQVVPSDAPKIAVVAASGEVTLLDNPDYEEP